MKNEPILLNDFRKQWEQVGPRALEAFERVGKSGWLVLGQEVEAFEVDLARYWGADWAVGCGNGLDGLEISLRCLGLKPGEKVLTTPLSAFATSLAIIRAGGVPVFVDVDQSGHLDLELCEATLHADPDIRFLMPVHLYGHAMNLERLETLKNQFSLLVVEDCAQAIGARSGNRPVGTLGQMAATSFYPTKNLGCMGDGGAIIGQSLQQRDMARQLRDYGQTDKYIHDLVGMNSRLDEVQAAILQTALLPCLDQFIARRRTVAEGYQAGLSNSRLVIPPVPRQSESVWHLFPVLVDGDRESFQGFLRSKGIASGLHYPRLISDQGALSGEGKAVVVGSLENAGRFAEKEVSLPIHPSLGTADIARVVDACNAWKG
jgi:dTDP-3-amino-3,4,6-trideoxy-alpha-D-glucose transaminase